MRQISKILALSLALAAGCSKAAAPQATTPEAPAAARQGLQIGLTTIYVDDQERALRFYTEVLGLAAKDDVSNEGFRWLTVTSPGDTDGIQLQLALDDNPAGKAYQEAMFNANQPAIMFYTDDVRRDHARIKAAGGVFTMEPTDIDVAIIAQLPDTCGNLIQISQIE
jgi:predicted enzyme related to lactoylglutathione lyase